MSNENKGQKPTILTSEERRENERLAAIAKLEREEQEAQEAANKGEQNAPEPKANETAEAAKKITADTVAKIKGCTVETVAQEATLNRKAGELSKAIATALDELGVPKVKAGILTVGGVAVVYGVTRGTTDFKRYQNAVCLAVYGKLKDIKDEDTIRAYKALRKAVNRMAWTPAEPKEEEDKLTVQQRNACLSGFVFFAKKFAKDNKLAVRDVYAYLMANKANDLCAL
jgi:hypothetical protein